LRTAKFPAEFKGPWKYFNERANGRIGKQVGAPFDMPHWVTIKIK